MEQWTSLLIALLPVIGTIITTIWMERRDLKNLKEELLTKHTLNKAKEYYVKESDLINYTHKDSINVMNETRKDIHQLQQKTLHNHDKLTKVETMIDSYVGNITHLNVNQQDLSHSVMILEKYIQNYAEQSKQIQLLSTKVVSLEHSLKDKIKENDELTKEKTYLNNELLQLKKVNFELTKQIENLSNEINSFDNDEPNLNL